MSAFDEDTADFDLDEPRREIFSLRQLTDPQVLTITGFPPYDGQWVRYEPPCNAPLNIKGEGFNCDKGWGHALPHGNTEAGAIWDGEQPRTDSPEPTPEPPLVLPTEPSVIRATVNGTGRLLYGPLGNGIDKDWCDADNGYAVLAQDIDSFQVLWTEEA